MGMSQSGKLAFVAGASGGIGFAVAEALLEEGAELICAYNSNPGPVEELRRRFGADRVVSLALDLSDEASLERAQAAVEGAARAPELYVDCVGTRCSKPFLRLSSLRIRSEIDLNLVGRLLLAKILLSSMASAGRGSAVIVTSKAAETGLAGASVYAASRAALNAFVKSAAAELAPAGLRLNALAPGYVEGELMSSFPDAAIAKMKERIALRRFASAKEVAQAAIFLLSESASYITGSIQGIDGGWA